jgi:hypothetical protein
MKYDLWDVEINRYVGQFEEESEALELVRRQVSHYSAAYADDLELSAVTAEGEALEPLSGAALIARAEEVLSLRQPAPQQRVGVGAKGGRRRSTSNDALAAVATGPSKRVGAVSPRKSRDQ